MGTFTFQGDPREAFYQFGLTEKDQDSSAQIISNLVFKNNKFLNFTAEKILGNSFSISDKFQHLIDGYIDGKCISEDQFKKNYLLGDIISLINSKNPGVLPNIGCSSLLTFDDSQVKHLRILDYPIGPYSSKFEWDLFFNLDGFNKVYSASFTDLPLPALTSINEHGISMALHQRNSTANNYRGSAIFDLTSECAFFSKNSDDILRLCENFSPINNWGLIFTVNSEKLGIEVEISPSSKPIVKKHNLKKDSFVYINNKSLQESNDKSFGDTWDKYCDTRTQWVNKNINEKNLLETFFKLPDIKVKDPFSFHPITPASIQSIEMNVTKNRFNQIKGDAVKSFNGEIFSTKINWTTATINQEQVGKKSKKHRPLEEYYSMVSKAQFYWDQKNTNKSLHYANRAIQLAPSKSYKSISQFFYSFLLFCSSKNKTLLLNQLNLLIEYYKDIPDFLQPDTRLLINYYLYYLDLPKIEIDELSSIHQNQFDKLTKLPKVVFKNLYKLFYVPRYETFSIGKVFYLIEAVGSP